MTLLQVRNKYISHFKSELVGNFNSIRSCPGVWGEEEIRAYSSEVPSLYVALLGASNVSQESEVRIRADVELAVYVFCSENKDALAENVAAELVQLVTVSVHQLDHMEFVHGPDIKNFQNLYSKKLHDIDVALWGIKIVQPAWIFSQEIQSMEEISNRTYIEE